MTWNRFMADWLRARTFVLDALAKSQSPVAGRHLRRMLNAPHPWWAFWRRWSAPAFYQMMAGLEKDGLVRGFYAGDWPASGSRCYVLAGRHGMADAGARPL